MTIEIPVQSITYKKEQRIKWENGDRADCTDPYCLRLKRTRGFGEYIAGKYFEQQGYRWIHHDFNIFGGNRPGKYEESEKILSKCLGAEKFEALRKIKPVFNTPGENWLEEPDLLIYKEDFSEIRFAETKRMDTRDELRKSQIRGLALIILLLGCKAEVYQIVEEGKHVESGTILFEF